MPLNITSRKDRDGRLQISGLYRGRRVRELTDFTPGQERKAKRLLEERRRELDTEIDAAQARAALVDSDDWRVVEFEDATMLYVEKGGEQRYLGRFDHKAGHYVGGLLEVFAGKRLGEIREKGVFEAIRDRWPDGVSNATKNRNFLGPLIAVFNAVRGAVPPVEKLKEAEATTRHATPQEVQDCLAAYADIPNLEALVLTMTLTGRRLGDLIKLPRTAIDERGVITISKTKNGDPITLVLPAFLTAKLLALPAYRNGRLFGWKARSNGIYEAMKARCAAAGITYLPPHQIGRHTFAMTALGAGMNVKEVQVAGDWKTLTALNRYLKLLPNPEQAKASTKIAAAMGLLPPDCHQAPVGGGNASKFRVIR